MKYTFSYNGGTKTVNIDDAWIKKQCHLLGISKREAIEMWLSDEGYVENDTVRELTERATQNKCGVVGASTKPRKKPERKPDYVKRAVIQTLKESLEEVANFINEDGSDLAPVPHDIEVTNIERVISFTIGDDKYEVTLSKKRKPKD